MRIITSEEYKDAILSPLSNMKNNDIKKVFNEFASTLKAYIYNDALERIKLHKDNNDILVLITGALEEYVRPIAFYLGIDVVIATKIKFLNNTFIGKIQRPEVLGIEKANAARKFMNMYDGVYKDIIVYTDSFLDLPLLQLARKGILVNARGKNSCKKFNREIWQ